MLEEDFQAALERNPHLSRYLDRLVELGEDLPDYYTQLSRDMRYLERINIIYPIGDPFFIHVKSTESEGWNRYIVVQPEIPRESWGIIRIVEEALAYQLVDREVPAKHEEKVALLSELLEKILVPDHSLLEGEYKPVRRGGIVRSIHAHPLFVNALRHVVLMDKTALGIIEPLIRDPYIEDISCDGVGPIFLEHKVFSSCKSSIEFTTHKEVDDFIYKLAEWSGRMVSIRSPISDAQLPDGSRINIVYGSDISRRGSNFTIRKFSDSPISITQLIKWGTISSTAAAYIWMLLENNLNVWFVGETASGKTTLLRAACAFIRPTAKIISIEDVPEIIVPHENWVSEVTRHGQEGSDSVELFDLLKAALRQRPNYIIVGEIRGREASIAFQAMQCVEDAYVATGHGCLLISEIFEQFRHRAQRDEYGRVIAHLPSPLPVYATSPGRLGVETRLCRAVIKIPKAERISIGMSDGGRIVVTPNHRFLVASDGGEREVEAREILENWRAGRRWVKLSKRTPPREGAASLEAEHLYRVPTSSPGFWWAMGRLLGGDCIRKRGGRYYWFARLGSREDYLRLRQVLEMTCWGGRDALSPRGRRMRAVFGPLKPQLIHWAMMNGLLVPIGGRLVGSARGLRECVVHPYLSGMMSAASSGSYISINGRGGVDALVEVLSSLRAMGIAGAARVVVRCSADRLRDLEEIRGVMEGLEERVSILQGGRSRFSARIYPNILATLNGGEADQAPGRDDLLRYLLAEGGEAEKIAVRLWLEGRPSSVFREGGRAYVYLNPPSVCWVIGVERAEHGSVYDLVIEGGGYYMGGVSNVMPIQDTGAGVISTFHAGSVAKIVQRLTGEPIEIPKTFIDNLNAVVIQSAVRSPRTGRLERRVLSINELIGIDEESGAINYIELFRWDPKTDTHEFRGEGNSYILDEKIATMLGLSRRELKRIYQELSKRRDFLDLLIEHGVLDYRRVYELITTTYKIGIETAMESVLEAT